MEGLNNPMYQWIFLYSIENIDYIEASDQKFLVKGENIWTTAWPNG